MMEFRNLKKQYEVLKPDIDKEILDVIENAHFISGPQVNEIEEKLSQYVGVKHCITCGNGTDALTIALKTWGIGKGDAVFVPDFTFFSSGESPAYVGATPIFVDVDKKTYNLDPEKLEESIKNVLNRGKYNPKVVIAVDLFGLPANYKDIRSICEKYGLLLLEDGAQGFGGEIDGRRACSFGDISTTSFFPAKPLGCYGDGGAIFTDNDDWADLIHSFCIHGKDTKNLLDPNAKYNNIRLGMNSRLDTIQAAILKVKLNAFIDYELEDINKIAKWYTDGLKEIDVTLPIIPKGYVSSWAQYTIQLPNKINRNDLQNSLKKLGIPTMIYYIKPMHTQEAFRGTDSFEAWCPITEKLCQTVLSIPIHPYMKKTEVDYVVKSLKEFVK